MMWTDSPEKDMERYQSRKAPALTCECCGEKIFEGDHYFCFDGEVWCDTCVENEFGRIYNYDAV